MSTHGLYRWLSRGLKGLAALGVGWAVALPAAAFTEAPNGTQFTLTGCRPAAESTTGGGTICANNEYTSGNLGKYWNELDLVPMRMSITGTGGTYNFYIAGDYQYKDGIAEYGYDLITVPVVNVALSDASCVISPVGDTSYLVGPGGAYSAIYRELQLTHNSGSTCVIDWFQRMSITSADGTSGSSLQAYTYSQENLSGGMKKVPTPVNDSVRQQISKTMDAARDNQQMWTVSKSATKASVPMGDVCTIGEPLTQTVDITVNWTKGEVSPAGDVTITTTVSAVNPAHRALLLDLTDLVYTGQTAGTTALRQATKTGIELPAGHNGTIWTFSYTIPAAEAGTSGDWVNDVVTATYRDPLEPTVAVGTATATAMAQIQEGATRDETASLSDLESIAPNALEFKITNLQVSANAGATASYLDGYTQGTYATQVGWQILGLTDSGSATFSKTIKLSQPVVLGSDAKLTDLATLIGADTGYKAESNLLAVGISSSARVTLRVSKTLKLALAAGESVRVYFRYTPEGGTSVDFGMLFNSTTGSVSLSFADLAPGNYTVTEVRAEFQATTGGEWKPITLVQDGTLSTQLVDLSVQAGGSMVDDKGVSHCSGSASFVNLYRPATGGQIRVGKITLPSGLPVETGVFKFLISGPGITEPTQVNGVVPNGEQQTVPLPLVSGVYTITEVSAAPEWDLISVETPTGVDTDKKICTVTVRLPADEGRVFDCTFTNRHRGKVVVDKLVNGGATTGNFTFELREGATSAAAGTILETLTTNSGGSTSSLQFATWLVPGAQYQICEQMSPGWTIDPATGWFVPNAGSGDNGTLCVNFTATTNVVSGAQLPYLLSVNNISKGGRAHTIGYWKTHASCSTTGASRRPTLDQTLYGMLPGGSLVLSSIDSIVSTSTGIFGQNANSTEDCPLAVAVLSKSTLSGVNAASNPLYGMASQLLAAELNIASGAYTCPSISAAITEAQNLLDKYNFDGTSLPVLSKPDANRARTLGSTLDAYNNNLACQP